MDISFIFPPLEKDDSYHPFFPKTTFPPLGIASIAAVLEESGYKVNIYDCEVTGFSYNNLIQLIRRKKPKIIGVSTLTVMIHRSLKAARILKSTFPDIPIVFGGPHATIFPEITLKEKNFVDFVVIGEGEYTTLELLQELEKSNPNFSKIRGIGYKENGRVNFNERRPYIKNIDELPLPARHLLPIELYEPSKRVVKKPPATHAVVSRGCPFRCTFCSKAIWGQTVRERSPEKVLEELIYLKEKYKINDVIFADDTFTINKKRVLRICELIRENKLDMYWSCLTRADKIDKELLVKMRDNGCHQIAYGVESGNQEILDIMKKDITLNQIRYAFNLTHKVGIETRGFFMFGLPGETRERSAKTLNFIKELDPDYANIYIYSPYPGTELFEIAQEMGTIKNFNWSQFDKFSPIYTPKGRTREEILQTYKLAFRQFYLTPHYIKKRIKKIRNLYDFQKNFTLAYQLIRGLLKTRLKSN